MPWWSPSWLSALLCQPVECSQLARDPAGMLLCQPVECSQLARDPAGMLLCQPVECSQLARDPAWMLLCQPVECSQLARDPARMLPHPTTSSHLLPEQSWQCPSLDRLRAASADGISRSGSRNGRNTCECNHPSHRSKPGGAMRLHQERWHASLYRAELASSIPARTWRNKCSIIPQVRVVVTQCFHSVVVAVDWRRVHRTNIIKHDVILRPIKIVRDATLLEAVLDHGWRYRIPCIYEPTHKHLFHRRSTLANGGEWRDAFTHPVLPQVSHLLFKGAIDADVKWFY